MSGKCFRRTAAAFLTALLIAGIAAAPLTVSADTKSQLEQKLSQLEAQEKKIKSQLSGASSDLSASQQRKNLLDSQIDNVEQQITLVDKKLADLESRMKTTRAEIDAAKADIEAAEASVADIEKKLGERMRAVQKRGNSTALQMLMNTDNYVDYLLQTKAVQRIAAQDQELIDQTREAIRGIKKEQSALQSKEGRLESQQAEAEELRQTAQSKKKQLDTLFAAAQTEVRKLQSTVSGYNAQLKDIQAEMKKTDQAITRLIQSTKSTGTYNQNMMFWPVPTVRALSDVYGIRWGKLHKGIDIANGSIPIYGENIVAAADGVVIYANSSNTWGGGYGYYCIVDHGVDSKGRTITTLYAHCSVLYAKVGQRVTGGKTVLGKAGKTGHVTGPHLHFEVRVNGTAVNPLNTYVSPKVN